jgi:hypothetical protein
MAISPASGALSQTQLALLEQIRALRAAKSVAPAQATTPIPSPLRIEAEPVVAQSAPAQPLATAAAGPMPANRPRGSIINISV